MTLYILLLIFIPTVWIALEIGLVIRDNTHSKGTTARDQGTRYLNFIATIVGIITAACLSGLSKFFFPGGRTAIVFSIGIAVMLLGMALRYWAVSILGAAFRTTIETDRDQKVVSRGPYKLIRHPSYTGWLLICCGYGIAVQNWLSLLVAVALPLAAVLHRVHLEEAALAASLGAEYVEYQQHTRKLIPWIW